MITYVNTVLVGKNKALATAAPAAAANMSTPSADAGKYIIMNCDDNIAASKLYVATAADASVLDVMTCCLKGRLLTECGYYVSI